MMNGCFIGLKLTSESLKVVVELQKQLSLKHPILESNLHLTLLCSHDVIEKEIQIDSKLLFQSSVIGLRQLKKLDGKSMLVIALKSNELSNRHLDLQKNNNINHYYNNYKPHITIADEISKEDAIVIKKVILKEFKLILTEEYMEHLK
jgi:2'-5' RNA ligase